MNPSMPTPLTSSDNAQPRSVRPITATEAIELRMPVDARTAASVFNLPVTNVGVHEPAALALLLEGTSLNVVLELRDRTHHLAAYSNLNIQRAARDGMEHIDVIDSVSDRCILAIGVDDDGEPHYAYTCLPAQLGLPGGRYDRPQVAMRTRA